MDMKKNKKIIPQAARTSSKIKILRPSIVLAMTMMMNVNAFANDNNSQNFTVQTTQLSGIEAIDEVHLDFENGSRIIRTYRLNSDDDINSIPRQSFTLGGTVFTFYGYNRMDTDRTERRQHTHSLEIETRTSDINSIMSSLPTFYEYENQYGFRGTLDLVHSTISTNPMPHRYERRTLTDTRNYTNLNHGDLSGIARTMTRNGVTLNLQDVVFTRNTTGIDFNQVANTYNATAHYSGVYSRRVIPGFITTADFTGEIVWLDVNPEILYEVTFVGANINTPAPILVDEAFENDGELNEEIDLNSNLIEQGVYEQDINQIEQQSSNAGLITLASSIILIPVGLGAYFLNRKFDIFQKIFRRKTTEDVYVESDADDDDFN